VINSRTARPLVTASLALVLGAPAVAWSQDVGPYDPLGIRAGPFRVYPTLNVSEEYNDNIFATDNDTVDDFITIVAPRIRAESDFSRHRVSLSTGGEFGFYASETDENYQDAFVAGDGRLDITRQNFIDVEGEIARGHDARDDPEDDQNRDKIKKFNRYGGQLSFTQLFNRLNFRLSGGAVRTAYEESEDSDRDRNVYDFGLRTGYFVSPRINAFVEGTYNIQKRDRRQDFGGTDRDSEGWGAGVGAEIDLTNLIVGEFSFGYRLQSYDDDDINDKHGLGYGIDLTWTPTLLTTVLVSGSGDFKPTSSSGSDAESNFESGIGVNVSHELRRNIVLNAGTSYTRDDFSGINRTDDTVGVGGGASYLINRNFSINAGYRFTKRWSDESDEEFDRNVIRVGVSARL
jgi:hypothetical protein